MTQSTTSPSGRLFIIGAGNVGTSIAYSVLSQEICKHIILCDIAIDLAQAHVYDLQDASNFTQGIKVSTGNYEDLIDGDIVIITCGAAQKDGQTRMDLLQINAKIIKDVIKNIKETKKQVYILMVTNPVDVLTQIAVNESGLPKGMVFGSGTYLDTGRLRSAIADQVGINPVNVHAYILGEHGDSSFPVLSSAYIGGICLTQFCNVDEDYYASISSIVRQKAYEIIKGKKATYYGIGSAVAKLVKSIIRDENRLFTLSIPVSGEYGISGISIGLPVKLSAKGFEFIGEVKLNEKERTMLEKSAGVLRESLEEV
jgi:L-lactate dehydrogenase